MNNVKRDKQLLVILGSSLTALAVVREASLYDVETVLIDSEKDITYYSSIPRKKYFGISKNKECLQCIKKITDDYDVSLVATSDRWLSFIIDFRSELDNICTILHANNEILQLCLDKKQFSDWCVLQGVSVPRPYSIEELNRLELQNIKLPLLMRPQNKGDLDSSIPKTVNVTTASEMSEWIGRFQRKGIEPSISESLLGDDLLQYSVGISRKGCETRSLVLVKRRPLPEDCAVGTYVEQVDNKDIEYFALEIIEKLDYQGIAEVEILHSLTRGRNYVIEINARPWIQFSVSKTSGVNLLEHWLCCESLNNSRPLKPLKKAVWINFTGDLFVCFSRSMGVVKGGRLAFLEYFRSLLMVNACSKFSIKDPVPFLWDMVCVVKKNIFK